MRGFVFVIYLLHMKKIVKLTESDLVKIVKRVINEQSEQSKKLYTSWANKKSGNPEMAMSIMDDVLKFQRSLPMRDFAKYSSYEQLKKDLDKVIGDRKEKDATKVYEDKDLLIIQANTWEASCKYGAGTKWCTAGRDTPVNWERYNRTGTEFIWIFKNKPNTDPGYKYSHHIKPDDGQDWCDALNNCRVELSDKSYPKQHPKYDEIIEKLKSIHNERNIVDPDRERKLIDKLIYTWIDNHQDELEAMYLKDFNPNKLWKSIWSETLMDGGWEYDYEDVDPDELDNILGDLSRNIPPYYGNGDIEVSNVDFFYDVKSGIGSYMHKKQMAFTSENLERIINTIDVDMIATNNFFDSVDEEIAERMKETAYEMINDELRDRLGI